MAELDPTALLLPIAEQDACGEALDYDLDFMALEGAAQPQGTPDSLEPPDWPEMRRLAMDLARRSMDLRIGVLLSRVGLHQAGFAGLAPALSLLAGYIEQYWAGVHPLPDTDDADDLTVRVSALANLCDPAGLLGELRAQPLLQVRGLGPVNFQRWADLQRADAEPQEVSGVIAAFQQADPSQLRDKAAALTACETALTRIDAGLRQRLKTTEMVELEPLARLLRDCRDVFGRFIVAERARAETVATAPAVAGDSYEIRDRNDVLGAIDRICLWYRMNEPGSPVPVLLSRARRLVAKDFLSLLMELAPDGVGQFRLIAGSVVEGE